MVFGRPTVLALLQRAHTHHHSLTDADAAKAKASLAAEEEEVDTRTQSQKEFDRVQAKRVRRGQVSCAQDSGGAFLLKLPSFFIPLHCFRRLT